MRLRPHASAYGLLSIRAKQAEWLESTLRWCPATCRCGRCGIEVPRAQLSEHRDERCPGQSVRGRAKL